MSVGFQINKCHPHFKWAAKKIVDTASDPRNTIHTHVHTHTHAQTHMHSHTYTDVHAQNRWWIVHLG